MGSARSTRRRSRIGPIPAAVSRLSPYTQTTASSAWQPRARCRNYGGSGGRVPGNTRCAPAQPRSRVPAAVPRIGKGTAAAIPSVTPLATAGPKPPRPIVHSITNTAANEIENNTVDTARVPASPPTPTDPAASTSGTVHTASSATVTSADSGCTGDAGTTVDITEAYSKPAASARSAASAFGDGWREFATRWLTHWWGRGRVQQRLRRRGRQQDRTGPGARSGQSESEAAPSGSSTWPSRWAGQPRRGGPG